MPLNAPEKVAALYLRLNGFFLMPQFTVFSSEFAQQTDILAVRLPDSEERVGDKKLSTDARFFKATGDPKDRICIVAEVKGDERWKEAVDQITRAFPYSIRMFGRDSRVRKVVFCKQRDCMIQIGDLTRASVQHCLWWIINRLGETQGLVTGAETISKYGSWTWSEDFLSDLLFLSGLGAKLTLAHSCNP